MTLTIFSNFFIPPQQLLAVYRRVYVNLRGNGRT
jgi:hypothetical protein